MPTKVAEKPTTKKVPASRGSRGTAAGPLPTQPGLPVPDDPYGEDTQGSDEETRTVDGIAVISDHPMPSPLPAKPGQKPIVFHGFRVLTLADGSIRHGCGECPDSTLTTGTLGEIRKHRARVHGMRAGGGGMHKRKAADQASEPMSASMLAMPLGEIVELGAQLDQLGDVFAQLTVERDEYKERALFAEREVRRYERAFSSLGLIREDS